MAGCVENQRKAYDSGRNRRCGLRHNDRCSDVPQYDPMPENFPTIVGLLRAETIGVRLPAEKVRFDLSPPITPSEDAMLDATASERRPNSRLSCQLIMNEQMDGLIVKLPETEA